MQLALTPPCMTSFQVLSMTFSLDIVRMDSTSHSLVKRFNCSILGPSVSCVTYMYLLSIRSSLCSILSFVVVAVWLVLCIYIYVSYIVCGGGAGGGYYMYICHCIKTQ